MNNEPTEIRLGGTQIWKNSERKYHRDGDLPAVIYPNGLCAWFQNGEFIKSKYCTKEEAKEYKKPYLQQKKFNTKFDRFEKLIKE